jgi:hypothetical protein
MCKLTDLKKNFVQLALEKENIDVVLDKREVSAVWVGFC